MFERPRLPEGPRERLRLLPSAKARGSGEWGWGPTSISEEAEELDV